MMNKLLKNSLAIQQQCLRVSSMSTSAKKLDLSGVFTPIATPFNNDESINYGELAKNFQKWNSSGLSGYLVQGSNGEFVYMTAEERVELIRRARESIPADKLLLAGAGAESTRLSILMSEKMAEAGADALVHVTPHYYKGSMNDRTLIAHFTEVADKSPLPVILYSVPANTGIDLSVDAISVLSAHPNIIGIKDSIGDITKLASIVSRTEGNDFQVLAGSAGYLLPALHVGCVGGISALANVLPSQVSEVHRMFLADRNNPELLSLHQSLIAPNSAVTKVYGVAGLKAAMEWFGLYGGPVRKPLLPLVEKDFQNLRQIFKGFL